MGGARNIILRDITQDSERQTLHVCSSMCMLAFKICMFHLEYPQRLSS